MHGAYIKIEYSSLVT